MDSMANRIHVTELFGLYGPMLTEKQYKCLSMYLDEDFSLSEIGEDLGVSRQAVHDLIKRCTKDMEAKEEALHLIERFRKVREDVSRLSAAVSDKLSDSDAKKVDEIISHILEEL